MLPPPLAQSKQTSPPSLRVQYLDKRFRVALTKKPMTIGRLKENHLCIELPSLSRRHAVIEYQHGSWTIKDLGSSNGIVYKGKQVKNLVLSHNISFRLGDALFSTIIEDNDETAHDKAQTRIITEHSLLTTKTGHTTINSSPTQEAQLNELHKSESKEIIVGSEIGGYRIEKKLHSDNLQTSYQAHQLSIDRTVTLKVLNSNLTEQKEFVEKFAQQAKISGSYNHPNIVHTLDCNQVDGIFFYTVEWVDGATLTELLAQEKRLPVSQSLDIVSNIAEALQYIHQKKATHQNIKPDSIIVKTNGEAKLADVGLFAIFDGDSTQDSRIFVGSPIYMSPEQARGKQLSDRSDVYSLGAILYHMVTNRPPFKGTNPVTIIQQKLQSMPKPPKNYDVTIDDNLNNLIMEMLQKDPKMRPSITKVLGLLPDIHSNITPVHISANGNSTLLRKKKARKRKFKNRIKALIPFVLIGTLVFGALAILTPPQRSFALEKAPWLHHIFTVIDIIKPPTSYSQNNADTTFISFEDRATVTMPPLPKTTSRMALHNWVQQFGQWKTQKKSIIQDNLDGGSLQCKTPIKLDNATIVLRIKSLLYPVTLTCGDGFKLMLNAQGLKCNFATSYGKDSRSIPLKLNSEKPIRLDIISKNEVLEIGINGTRIYRGVIAGLNEIEAKLEVFTSGRLEIQRFEF